MNIAVLWSRFGPYHLARLGGLAEVAQGTNVVGIEVAARDHYDWDVVSSYSGFQRDTLFDGRSYGELSAAAIRRAVTTRLEGLRPRAVAVNGWSMPEALAAVEWCARRGSAAIIMSETKEDDGRRVWWRERVKRWRLSRCGAALVGGRPHVEYLRLLGMPASRVFMGYDAVDNDYFARGGAAAQEDAQALRERYSLPAQYFFVCTRFISRKNVDGLIRAYARYVSAHPSPWSLVIAGGGAEEEALRAQVDALGLGSIHFAGFVQYPDLPVYYGLASAFVHPAHAEPWGLVLNEAAACGLPLLAGRTVGAAYELIEDGWNGWKFDSRDEVAMAATLGRISQASSAERQAMGERSRVMVSRFSPQKFGEGMLAAISACEKGAA